MVDCCHLLVTGCYEIKLSNKHTHAMEMHTVTHGILTSREQWGGTGASLILSINFTVCGCMSWHVLTIFQLKISSSIAEISSHWNACNGY